MKEDYTWKRDSGGEVAIDDDVLRNLRFLDGDKPGVCLWRKASSWGVAAEQLAAEGFRPAGGRITFTLVALLESEEEACRLASSLLQSWRGTEQRLIEYVRLGDAAAGGWKCDFKGLQTALQQLGVASTQNKGAVSKADSRSRRCPDSEGPQGECWQKIATDVAMGPLPKRDGPLIAVTGVPTFELLVFEHEHPRFIWRVAYRGAVYEVGLQPEKKKTVTDVTFSRRGR